MTSPNQRIDKRAVFVGCARDCAQFLPSVLNNIGHMAGLFRQSAFVFVENDSRDATKQQLRSWCASRSDARVVSLDGLAAVHSQLTLRTSRARNEYLKIVKSEYRDFDYMFVLDCDDVNAQPIEIDRVVEATGFLEQRANCAAVFSNARGAYYDLWPLRQSTLCPNDIWEDLGDYALNNGVPDDVAYEAFFRKKIFQLDPQGAPVEVESAFGGLGIYKIPSILRNDSIYSGLKTKVIPSRFIANGSPLGNTEVGWLVCDHVSFNLGFGKNQEKLFILPYLINCTTVDPGQARFPASFWRTMLFMPKPSSQP